VCTAGTVEFGYAQEMKDVVVTATLTTGITSLIIAQEAAVIAAISA
jgi:hypothetical protein